MFSDEMLLACSAFDFYFEKLIVLPNILMSLNFFILVCAFLLIREWSYLTLLFWSLSVHNDNIVK